MLLPIFGRKEVVIIFLQLLRFTKHFNQNNVLQKDPGIGYVIEPPRSPDCEIPQQSVIPQEMDKQDFTLIGSKLIG